jgi:hypothetical protein
MSLGQFPRVWWTTGLVPGPRHGDPGKTQRLAREHPSALRAEPTRRCLQETGQTQPLLPTAHASARMRVSTGVSRRALLLATSS